MQKVQVRFSLCVYVLCALCVSVCLCVCVCVYVCVCVSVCVNSFLSLPLSTSASPVITLTCLAVLHRLDAGPSAGRSGGGWH